jgi:hypothetical protein
MIPARPRLPPSSGRPSSTRPRPSGSLPHCPPELKRRQAEALTMLRDEPRYERLSAGLRLAEVDSRVLLNIEAELRGIRKQAHAA